MSNTRLSHLARNLSWHSQAKERQDSFEKLRNEWVASHENDAEMYAIAKRLASRITYVTQEQFDKAFEESVDWLATQLLARERKSYFVYYQKDRSTHWLAFRGVQMLRSKYGESLRCMGLVTKDALKVKGRHAIVVFDDGMYSGQQAALYMNDVCNLGMSAFARELDLYMVIPYASPGAISKAVAGTYRRQLTPIQERPKRNELIKRLESNNDNITLGSRDKGIVVNLPYVTVHFCPIQKENTMESSANILRELGLSNRKEFVYALEAVATLTTMDHKVPDGASFPPVLVYGHRLHKDDPYNYQRYVRLRKLMNDANEHGTSIPYDAIVHYVHGDIYKHISAEMLGLPKREEVAEHNLPEYEKTIKKKLNSLSMQEHQELEKRVVRIIRNSRGYTPMLPLYDRKPYYGGGLHDVQANKRQVPIHFNPMIRIRVPPS